MMISNFVKDISVSFLLCFFLCFKCCT